MRLIGLTGSIASGKSEVAAIFRQAGHPVFDADQTVHTLYSNGQAAKVIGEICPAAVQGNIVDRKILSAAISADKLLLKKIEDRIHPLVRDLETAFIENHKSSNLIIIDSPLLIETQHHKDMDAVVVVSAPPKMQKERALARPNMTQEKLALVMAKQLPDIDKRQHANFIIENDSTLAALRERTLGIIPLLLNG